MVNLVAFLNSFLSYLLLFLVFVAIGAAAIALGIFLRKRKNAKDNADKTEAEDVETEVGNAEDSEEKAADTENE